MAGVVIFGSSSCRIVETVFGCNLLSPVDSTLGRFRMDPEKINWCKNTVVEVDAPQRASECVDIELKMRACKEAIDMVLAPTVCSVSLSFSKL